MVRGNSYAEGLRPVKPVLDFMQFLRLHNLKVGLKESELVAEVASELLAEKTNFKYGLRAICCADVEDYPLFDRLFETYWTNFGDERKAKIIVKGKLPQSESSADSAIMLGKSDHSSEKEVKEAKQVGGTNHQERLRKTDFSKVAEIEEKQFQELAFKLWRDMSYRLKRKSKARKSGSKIQFNKTLRANISKGGWPYDLVYKERVKKKRNLLMLLDVSGSMDTYSFFLLRFIYVLKQYFKGIEAFTFSTDLHRVTRHLQENDLSKALADISADVASWSSGTRIGECLKTFNSKYAKSMLSKSTIVVILSDGLDTGDPKELADTVDRIGRRSKQLVWLNPLKGMQGYQPIQKGMQSALPYVDRFQSAHNLDSLLALEKTLFHV